MGVWLAYRAHCSGAVARRACRHAARLGELGSCRRYARSADAVRGRCRARTWLSPGGSCLRPGESPSPSGDTTLSARRGLARGVRTRRGGHGRVGQGVIGRPPQLSLESPHPEVRTRDTKTTTNSQKTTPRPSLQGAVCCRSEDDQPVLSETFRKAGPHTRSRGGSSRDLEVLRWDDLSGSHDEKSRTFRPAR